jgi:hypothetical protein
MAYIYKRDPIHPLKIALVVVKTRCILPKFGLWVVFSDCPKLVVDLQAVATCLLIIGFGKVGEGDQVV